MVTQLLQRWSEGDVKAAGEVLPLVYEELRRIALKQLRCERGGHTLEATAVVHEAYLRLNGQKGLQWPSRAHFFAFAAHLIRRILVDHARSSESGQAGRADGEGDSLRGGPSGAAEEPRLPLWMTRSPAWRRSIRARPRS